MMTMPAPPPEAARQGAIIMPPLDPRPRNGFSIDVEAWFQVGAFERLIPRDAWDALPSRVERNGLVLLDLLAEAHVKATFFTLGWVAARHGPLMRRIVAAGHELASHGWDHARVFSLSPPAFANDLAQARAAIEDAGGVRVRGYRAPSFSIDARTHWAHAILAEQGYAYSSSVAPLAHDHYGWRAAPRFAFRPLADAPLIELPVSTLSLAGRRLGMGGGFFRLLPYRFSRWAIARVNQREHRPVVFYCHPWEIDPDQPVMRAASWRARFRHYTGLGGMAGKLTRLLDDFAWGRIDALAAAEAPRAALWAPASPDRAIMPAALGVAG